VRVADRDRQPAVADLAQGDLVEVVVGAEDVAVPELHQGAGLGPGHGPQVGPSAGRPDGRHHWRVMSAGLRIVVERARSTSEVHHAVDEQREPLDELAVGDWHRRGGAPRVGDQPLRGLDRVSSTSCGYVSHRSS
jgi:hypothetical protein